MIPDILTAVVEGEFLKQKKLRESDKNRKFINVRDIIKSQKIYLML